MSDRLRAALDDASTRAARTAIDRRAFADADPATAIALLTERVTAGGDERIPALLWAAGASERVRAAAASGPLTRGRVASLVCWWDADHDARAADGLIAAARTATDPWCRAAAVSALQGVAGDEATTAIAEAAATGGPWIGAYAVFVWIARVGWIAYQTPPSPLATLALRASSPRDEVRAAAAVAIRELCAAAIDGVVPPELTAPALDPRAVERVRASVFGTGEIDVDSLIALRGVDRRYAIDLLMGRLGLDPRVPAALAWLGVEAS